MTRRLRDPSHPKRPAAMLAMDRLLGDAQAAGDVLPRPPGPARLFHLRRFEMLDQTA